MARSTKLEKLITDPLNTRLTTVESKVTTVETRSLVDVGDNVSVLVNDAGYQNATEVDTKIQDVVGAAPAALDTLKEIADALADDDNAIAALVTVNTTQNNAINSLETNDTSQDEFITDLFSITTNHETELDLLNRRGKIRRLTVTSDLTLDNNDALKQHLINQSGSDRTVTLPATPGDSQEFEVINNATSTHNILFAGEIITPGARHAVQWDTVQWVVM